MMSTTGSVVDFYSTIISNPHLLADGYTIISRFLNESQQNRKQTLINITNPQVPILSLLINLYPQQIFTNPSIDHSEKDNTVQFLLNLLVEQLLKTQDQLRQKEVSLLFQLMNKIHNIQGFERWVGYYIQALSKLASKQSTKFWFFLINILKYADDRVSVLSQQLLPLLINYQFGQKEEEKLEIYYYVIKSLAFRVDTDPEAIDTYVSPYLQTILQYAALHMKKSAKGLKFSLKIMTLLFGDYGIECNPQLVKQIQLTNEYLIQEYITFLNSSVNFQKGQCDFEDEQEPIEVALYQMLQLLMTLFGSKIKINLEKVLYLCIISTYLGEEQFRNYTEFSDQYLMDVEDEGEMNIRNKSTYFLGQLIENDKYGKKCVDLLREYTAQVLLNLSSINSNVKDFLQKYRLPLNVLKIAQIYTQSALFILYSFTDELIEGKVSEISVILGNQVKTSLPKSIDPILSILILNKCVKGKMQNQKGAYLSFLKQMVEKYSSNVGMLITIARGIYECSPIQELIISDLKGNGVPFVLVNNLNEYLLRNDSAQQQSAYLILQFFLHLLKWQPNKPLLQHIITFEKQITLLKKYLSSGMASVIIMELTEKLASPRTLEAIYQQIQNGYVKDENLGKIISKCIKSGTISLSESQIVHLCQVYSHKLDLISSIVAAFTQASPIQNEWLVTLLSKEVKAEWLPGLLKQGKLKDIDHKFTSSVNLVTNVLESLDQIQNELIVPYFAILHNTQTAIFILNTNNILLPFFQKLSRYARLFQGIHLKIITSHVFISLAEKLPHLKPKVIELVHSYGKIESEEWEDDEDELMQFGENFEVTEGLIQKMFDRIVNEKVEEILKTAFGQLSWDSKRLYQRLALLEKQQ